jgi:hypothetical protein
MKLLWCEDCGDIVAPYRIRYDQRFCVCGRHAIWLESDAIVRVCDTYWNRSVPVGGEQRAWVLHIVPDPAPRPDASAEGGPAQLVTARGEDAPFGRLRAFAIRLRPGEAADSGWALTLPDRRPAYID